MSDLFGSSILIGEEPFLPQDSKLLSNSKQFFKISSSITEKTDVELSHFNRSLPRDGFLSFCSLDLAMNHIDLNSFEKGRIGLYTAFMNGPILSELFNKIKDLQFTEGMAYAKKWWPPKQHFRQNAPLRATHFAIKYKLNGPQMCFVNPETGLQQAIDAAKIDLALHQIDLAIVTSAFSFEDWQIVDFYSQNCQTMKEASVSFVFNNPLQKINIFETTQYDSGICTPCVHTAHQE